MKKSFTFLLPPMFLLLLINANAQTIHAPLSSRTNRHPVRNTNDINTNGGIAHPNDIYDLSSAPLATQAEIDEFNNLVQNQNGVGVLGGDNTRPFYYHTDQSNEPYKYRKLIDASRLPSGFDSWAEQKLKKKLSHFSHAGTVVSIINLVPFTILEWPSIIKDLIPGRQATTAWVDCWYPVSEIKSTLCGKTDTDSHMCDQDYLHTKVTVDKDVNIDIAPSDNFKSYLNNPWLSADEQKGAIEAEVRATLLFNYDTKTHKSIETLVPHNPLLLIPQNVDVCVYGPWMADILDIEGIGVFPIGDHEIDLTKVDLNTNNEIHPINQIWYNHGAETQLIAIADGNGYFEKKGNLEKEIEASGLHHPMRFYIAFQINKPRANVTASPEYDITGVGLDLGPNRVSNLPSQTLTLHYHGNICIKVNDIFQVQKTHRVFFDKLRTRPDGSAQGYIVVETVPIVKRGGSINISVKRTDQSLLTTPASPVPR